MKFAIAFVLRFASAFAAKIPKATIPVDENGSFKQTRKRPLLC